MRILNTGVHLTLPPAWQFQFPPDPAPLALPPSSPDPFHWRSPFPVDQTFYNEALAVQVPITFAIGYFFFVTLWNQVNRQRGFKPWAFSKTDLFSDFALVHNILLAVYSGLTCIALSRALWVSTPGWLGPHGAAGQVDALCKMQGPRGYGDAVAFDTATSRWNVKNSLIHLDPSELRPDPTDVGRIWNEGLAFWGWLFYLSKFYEVVDTILVLSKGRRATTLQVFHHIGAVFAMWAGIRFMSAPIWMFVMVNSFIHTLMYSYYTASTLKIEVPASIKRSITTLQISQFLLGTTYALAHLFISYDVPISTPYKVVSAFANPGATASDAWTDFAHVARSTGPFPPWLKRLAYRAVGAEGLAESVHDGHIYTDRRAYGTEFSPNPSGGSPFQTPANASVRHSTHYEVERCIDTSGQAFAIMLNVIYLMPLTFLFARFFVKSYITGTSKTSQAKIREQGEGRRFSESVEEAARRTSDVVESLGSQAENSIDEAAVETEENAQAMSSKARNAGRSAKDTINGSSSGSTQSSTSIRNMETSVQQTGENVKESLDQGKKKFDKMMKDSSLGDSYVQVIEKMREGAMQASGSTDADESFESNEQSSGSEQQTSSSTQATSSSSNDRNTSTTVSDTGDATSEAIKGEIKAEESTADEAGEDAEESSQGQTYAETVKEGDGGDEEDESKEGESGSWGFGLHD